jgi:ATP-dependent RNA helicase DeaD
LGDEFDMAQIAAAAIKMAMDGGSEEPTAQDHMPTEDGMERLFIRVGRRDGVAARDIVGAIANEAHISGQQIGTIDIYDNFSFAEVPRQQARTVIEALNRATIRGRRVKVDIAVPSQPNR